MSRSLPLHFPEIGKVFLPHREASVSYNRAIYDATPFLSEGCYSNPAGKFQDIGGWPDYINIVSTAALI
jgi:hypothetical protein